jgi:hypothetical protein
LTMEKKITIKQGFLAMEKFLIKWYGFIKSDDIQFLLGGMDLDPAFWEDWIEAIETVLKEEQEKNKS